MQAICNCNSPIGDITLAAEDGFLTALCFDGQKYFDKAIPQDAQPADLPVFCETKQWLALYFAGKIPDFTPPFRLTGTPFRKAVLENLLTIPYGCTVTYGALAVRITGNAKNARAVGHAVGHNPISLILPCHRVLGTSGALTGYAGGIDRKRFLLALEAGR